MMDKAKAKGVKLLIPVDTVVAKEFSNDAEHKTVERGGIEPGWQGLDIGEKTIALYKDAIKDAIQAAIMMSQGDVDKAMNNYNAKKKV